MILSFSHDAFVEKIKSGTKIHTIRRNAAKRWEIGDKIHFWKDNPRNVTKSPYFFGTGIVTGIRPIAIRYLRHESSYGYAKGNKFVEVYINSSKPLTRAECETLAKNDGFESFDEFLDWFNQDFVGGVIFWSNFEEKNQ